VNTRPLPHLALALLLAGGTAGCAGQLDLAPEAYATSAASAGAPGPDAGAPAPAPAPAEGWDAGSKSDAAGYGPNNLDAGWAPQADAAAPAPAPVDAWPAPAVDTGPAPVASVCPPGVDALSLIAKRCGNCHGERSPAKNLDLVTAGLATRLAGIKSTCMNRPLLDLDGLPDKPTGHFLDKLAGPVAGCGAQMPYGTPPIVGAERDCLIEWSAKAIARAQKGN
jgi:hypothetical protein